MKYTPTPSCIRLWARQLVMPAALSGLLLVSASAFAQPDLIIAIDMTIPTGTYHNIEIRPGVNATVGGEVTVTGTFQVDSAGTVAIPGVAHIDGNTFRMLADARLNIESAGGVDGTTAGPIRTVTKDFGIKARITFSSATVPQITGLGFPDELSELVINNALGVTLSRPLGVRERLHLRNGSLITAGFKLTLISRTPDITNVTAASALIFNQNLTGNIIGNVTAQRWINPRYNAGVGYRHFSSSVHGNTVSDFSTAGFAAVVNARYNTVPYNRRFIAGQVTPYPNVFFYDEAQVGTGGSGTYDQVFTQGYQSPNLLETPLNVLSGYSIRISAAQTVDFVGSPNNGPYTTGPLTRRARNESGWHLFGNPYPSKMDWTLVSLVGMDNSIYKYRSTGSTAGIYDAYVNGVSTGPSGNEFIAANQAVFTHVTAAGVSGSISFDNSCRIIEFRDDPTAPFFRGASAATPRPLTRLMLDNAAGLHDEAVIYFENGGTTGFDSNFDALYLNGGNAIGLSVPVGGEKVSINGLPALTAQTDYTVPLVVNVTSAGVYTLDAREILHFPAGFQVLLQDALTNQIQNLGMNPVYPFSTVGQNADSSRFSLRFRAADVTGLTESLTAGAIEVYPNPANPRELLTINVAGVEAGKKVSAVIYNLIGQPVWSATLPAVLGGVRATVSMTLPQGVYNLQVILPTGAKQSRRMIVQ